eukprot:9320303-Pyramimonas_sp.AAC.1
MPDALPAARAQGDHRGLQVAPRPRAGRPGRRRPAPRGWRRGAMPLGDLRAPGLAARPAEGAC